MIGNLTFTKFEHSAFTLGIDGVQIAVDFGSETLKVPERVRNGLIGLLVSHRHGDHLDLRKLTELNSVPIYGPGEVVDLARAAGLTVQSLSPTTTVNIGPFSVSAFDVDHGPLATRPLQNYGLVIRADDRTVVFCGDMARAPAHTPTGDLLLVPVSGEGFVFDPQQAAAYVRTLRPMPGAVVPVHFSDNAGARFKELCADVDIAVHVLHPGASIEVPRG